MDNDKIDVQHTPFYSGLAPVRRACGAKTRAGTPCKKWTVKGKTRCRNHGGASTGAKTIEGRERIRLARLIHGNYTVERLKQRIIRRFKAAGFETLERKIMAMPTGEFLARRGELAQCARKLARKNKKIMLDTKKVYGKV